ASITLHPESRAEDERIGISESSFAWSTDFDGSLTPSKRNYLLRIDREIIFKPNCLNVIVGSTGSGKTSMLMALLGEMHYIPNGPNSWFNLPRQNGVAYAAQESWILNQTIKVGLCRQSHLDILMRLTRRTYYLALPTMKNVIARCSTSAAWN